MGKTILVMDTPENCEECLISEFDGFKCRLIGCNMSRKESMEKPSWCPLKEVPDKKKEKQYMERIDNKGNIETYGEKEDYYAVGWNDCIDEILKGCD